MTISRRDFLLAGSTFAAASLAGSRAWARAQPTQPITPPRPIARQVNPAEVRHFEWKKAAEGVFVAFGEGGNALVMAGKDESLLVDTKNAGFGEQLRLVCLRADGLQPDVGWRRYLVALRPAR